MSSNRLVGLMFFIGGIVLAYVTIQAVDWVWGYFAKPPALWVDSIGLALAGGSTFAAWRHPVAFSAANEVAVELGKVTWPTREETKWATVIVMVTVAIGAVILSTYDLLWSWLTGLVYG